MCHNADMNQARLAGLLHDCAKCIPNSKKLKICQRENIPVSAAEEASPDLLHAKLGVYISKEKYGVTDREGPAGGPLPYHWTSRNDTS